MGLEDRFNQALERWIAHCGSPNIQASSSSLSSITCYAYKQIVEMGLEALPLIREVYDRATFDDGAFSTLRLHGLVLAVREIAGDDFKIPIELQGNMPAVEEYTKRWLDENGYGYGSDDGHIFHSE